MLAQPFDSRPERDALRFLGDEVPDVAAALSGARDIAAERMSERVDVRTLVREATVQQGRLVAKAVKSAYANCASLWTRHLPLPLPQPLPPKNARPASRVKSAPPVKSANRARHVKSVNHAPSKPLPPAKKKY